MTSDRKNYINSLLPLLPTIAVPFSAKNGECLATDEAEIWKRILNFRIIEWLKPARILETHAGKGVGTALMKTASANTEIISLTDCEKPTAGYFDFIDIDPFGQPYKAFIKIKQLSENGIVAITTGEIISVVRGLKNTKMPTSLKGKDAWKWVESEWIPFLEKEFGMNAQYFYAYPTSVRVFLSKKEIPAQIFADCPKYMWWFNKYAQCTDL